MTERVATSGAEQPAGAHWRISLIALACVVVALLLLFSSTVGSMVEIWYNRETYTHGFIILPISIWLIWQKREHLAMYMPQPSFWPLSLVAATLSGWILASLTGVLVVEQLAFVALLVAAIIALVGWQVSKFLAFPLLFLFFAVPMGEDLVPIMMEYTADFTVGALKLTGIPVYREGLFFSLPTGDWSVVEACSGVRYLIASGTLGVMYAYITYQTLWKRLLFVVLSFAVPILANGLRAYMIVMIGHLSDMKLATGVDHVFYGWVFFGIVMFLLFWIGGLWQEEHEPPSSIVAPAKPRDGRATANATLAVAALTLAMSGAAVWMLDRAQTGVRASDVELELPAAAGEWRRAVASTTWQAVSPPGTEAASGVYDAQADSVQLFVNLFPVQTQGFEAISIDNGIAQHVKRQSRMASPSIDTPSGSLRVNQSKVFVEVDGAYHVHLVWQWYRVAGHMTTNRYLGKFHEALARIYSGRTDGAWVAVTTPLPDAEHGVEAAQQRLSSFVLAMVPLLDESIDGSLGIKD